MQARPNSTLRIGFVATRFAGTDGVSLEAEKWAVELRAMGHDVYYFAGIVDRPPEKSREVPEAFFGHPGGRGHQRVRLRRCLDQAARSRSAGRSMSSPLT